MADCFFDNGSKAFFKDESSELKKTVAKNTSLENDITDKNGVIAELFAKRSLEKYPNARPRLITDNGSQYTSHEFKQFISRHGLTHVRTSPYYPQSNGEMERFHYAYKDGAVRPMSPLSIEDARRVTEKYIEYYNNERLHSAIGFITPKDKLEGRDQIIIKQRNLQPI